MKALPLISLLSLAAIHGHAFVLDSSCDSYRANLIPHIESAFKMADLAQDTVTKTVYADRARWKKFSDVSLWLFDDDGTRQNSNLISSEGVRATFDGILTMRNERTMATYNDVIFFCTLDRIKRRGNNQLYDTRYRIVHAIKDQVDAIKTCGLGSTMAFTVSKGSRPSIIQLCPGYLKATISQIVFSPGNWWAKFLSSTSQRMRGWAYTPIDVRATLDVTILHELTHTRAGLFRDDVGGSKGAYFWDNCVKLGNQTDTRGDSLGIDNADSYAYYALACRIINMDDEHMDFSNRNTDPNRQATVNRDGTLTMPATAAKLKREAKRLVKALKFWQA